MPRARPRPSRQPAILIIGRRGGGGVRAGIYGGAAAPPQAVRRVRDALDDSGIKAVSIPAGRAPRAAGADIDIAIVMGGDRAVRGYFHRSADPPPVPVLGLAEAESSGFLAQVDTHELASFTGRLRRGDYAVEEVPRIGVRIDGKAVYPVLNDIAVFPSRSAMLMEHTLRVDGLEVWHDSSDGIILSTPIGSSAYSMSAGGPVIFQDSRVFGIISVNSLDVTRRPLIVPDGSAIEVDDVSSRQHCEAVLDGSDRRKVTKSVDCTKSEAGARIVRMKKDPTAISALARKVHLAGDLLKMSPSSKLILKTLEYEGPLSQKDLASKTLLPARTVRLALRRLQDRRYVRRIVSARDARQKIYEMAKIA